MMYDYSDDDEEILQQLRQAILDVQGVISGMIGSVRSDVFMNKRTQTSADEIIGFLTIIDNELEEI